MELLFQNDIICYDCLNPKDDCKCLNNNGNNSIIIDNTSVEEDDRSLEEKISELAKIIVKCGKKISKLVSNYLIKYI